MRLFTCQHCKQLLYFENTECLRCGHRLGFVPGPLTLSALEPGGDEWRALADGGSYRFCENAGNGVCNWLVAAAGEETLCRACRHNHTIPDRTIADNLSRWQTLELAKHRLIYTLLRFGVPLVTRKQDPQHGLAFDFLADLPQQAPVMTGHDSGLITIALKEADDTERTRMREQMGELYRTPLGHFRHEVGHYYWDVLVRDGGKLDAFRAVFGDERADYAEALKAHYARPPAPDWQESFVSVYAASHPWEDFAETWAHYLHIVDTLEIARAFGISINPLVTRDPALEAEVDFDPYRCADIASLMDVWLPITFAMNSMSRAMGQPDTYPFVLSPVVMDKLGLIQDLLRPFASASASRRP